MIPSPAPTFPQSTHALDCLFSRLAGNDEPLAVPADASDAGDFAEVQSPPKIETAGGRPGGPRMAAAGATAPGPVHPESARANPTGTPGFRPADLPQGADPRLPHSGTQSEGGNDLAPGRRPPATGQRAGGGANGNSPPIWILCGRARRSWRSFGASAPACGKTPKASRPFWTNCDGKRHLTAGAGGVGGGVRGAGGPDESASA